MYGAMYFHRTITTQFNYLKWRLSHPRSLQNCHVGITDGRELYVNGAWLGSNGMLYIPNFMKTDHLFKKLHVRAYGHIREKEYDTNLSFHIQ
jgi:hypothetical protein